MSDKAILYIGTSSSRCGVCNKEAFPEEKTHAKVAGYFKNGSAGCGVKWTHVSTNYVGMNFGDMRPDLIWLDPMENINA